MTLTHVSEYDGERVPSVGTHAAVVGGSMAGLLAARVLADGFETVTLLERDPMPDESVARRGVPQSEHVHVLLEPGRVALEALFPGYGEDLQSAGGLVIDAAADLNYYDRGAYLAAGDEKVPMYCASRPLFERVARRRVLDRDGITVRPKCHVTDYHTDGEAVTGVELTDADGDGTTLTADLVVDATGRTSRTPAWLGENGYETPAVDEVSVDLAYSTVAVERPPEDRRAYLCAPSPPDTRGGTAVPVEGDRWLVTLFGMHGTHPPTDREGVETFASALAAPEIAAILGDHEWVSSNVSHYRFPSNQWHHYETLDRFPDGLLVTGDAVASFNPIYGQGMSVAALDALHLHEALAAGATDLAPRFFPSAAESIDVVWRMAVGADFEFPQTAGSKPTGTDLFNRYVGRLVETAHDDPRVAEVFARVLRLEKPPTALLRPGIAGRVLLPNALI